ncbi:subtilisin-like protein [Wolfiporia cocos MD-104 SS10]|uniref:tripeptidyl-peptidase II n=1 Tax=Wolfiporia cocos (strain MD-104) TaxID=742152 RepID=A0A2H3J233_WOLCO|nr:subtilisin-like protein [Wolfiporia cocos MD-104 SS10]
MIPRCVVWGLLSTLVASRAVPSPRVLQLHETRDSVPSGFTLNGPASEETVLNLRVALVQNNVDGLVDALDNVSNPASAQYGHHLSKEEVEDFVRPTSESVQAVNAWLNQHGLNSTTLSPAGDWISVQVPVSKANEILGANYSVFTHDQTGHSAIRTLSYSIPSDLVDHVALVHPTVTFPSGHKHSPVVVQKADPHADSQQSTGVLNVPTPQSSSPCSPGRFMVPTCLQGLYGIPSGPSNSSSNSIAVTGYDNEYAQESDLKQFLSEYRTDMNSSTTFTLQTVNGGSNPQNSSQAGIEANLDTQYVVGLATDVPVTFISTGGDFLDALLDSANYLLGQASPPLVVSTSYGDNENAVSEKLASTLCNAYAQLGARGVSVLFASGDGGVSGNQESQCTTFVPTFPSTCPYVTSVGSTYQLPMEQGVSFSGGGFSNYFAQPSYQSSAVSAYLNQLGSNNTGLYNATGRAYPDVSAFGSNYDIYSAGQALQVSGTSTSTPVIASIIALLNDQLLAAGRSSLGFLNPLLYAKGANAFTDIVGGNNLACDNGSKGFYAVSGWDPVTGLGTPIFSGLQSAVGL